MKKLTKKQSNYLLIIGILLIATFFTYQYQLNTKEEQVVVETALTPTEVVNQTTICENGTVKENSSNSLPTYKNNELMGYLSFPTIEGAENINLVYGDLSDDFEVAMNNGVAWDPESSLPGDENTVVVSGHREQDFKNLQYLEVGDPIVMTIGKNVYTYEVVETKVIDKEDVGAVYYNDNDLVMYTCYPFETWASKDERYLVIAEQVPSVSC